MNCSNEVELKNKVLSGETMDLISDGENGKINCWNEIELKNIV